MIYHRYSKWKGFLKGFFDLYEEDVRIFATGSARLDVYKRGGDSMMGRYFPYRIHPLSVAELVDSSIPNEKDIVRAPHPIDDSVWDALWTFGGFPEPLANGTMRFLRKWRSLRFEQLLREDVRDVTKSVEIDQIEALATILANRTGEQLVRRRWRFFKSRQGRLMPFRLWLNAHTRRGTVSIPMHLKLSLPVRS